MLLDSILFYAFAALIIFSAIMTITRRNVVHSAVWLISALVGVAGLYLLQGAEFLAGVQIIVYIGGIMVLFLFVIMLLNLQADPKEAPHWVQKIGTGALAAALAAVVAWTAVRAAGDTGIALAADFGTTKALARVLFRDYAVAFELTSVLLLVAVVGAVVLAKRDED
jgi:NADH-quinone oxidoreductase subunit J